MREIQEPPFTGPSACGRAPGNTRRLRPVIVGLVGGLLISAAVWSHTTHATPRAAIGAMSAMRGSTLPSIPHASGKAPVDLLSDSLCLHAGARCTWERTFGSASIDKAFAVASAADGRVFVAGDTRYMSTQQTDGWVLCLDRSGRILWDRRIGGRQPDQLYGIAPTHDGGAVVAGHTRSKGKGNSDVWVLRLGRDGDLIWEQTFGGRGDDRARTLAMTDSGDLLVAGYTRSRSARDGDGWILKLTGDGVLLWEHMYRGRDDDGILNIASMPDGGVVAAGYTELKGTSGYDAWALRLDDAGGLLWERKLDRGGFDAASAVVPGPDGGIVVAGLTSLGGVSQEDAWVIRLDAEGVVLWDRVFGGPKPDSAWGLVGRPNGGVIVSVATSSYGAGSGDAWLLELDQTGAVRWRRMYGGKYWDRPTGMAATPDGDLLMVGYTTTQGAGYEDYWVLRLDSDGLL